MNKFVSCGLLNWITKSVLIQLFVFLFLFILIVSPSKIPNNKSSCYQNVSESFHKTLLQARENFINNSSKLVCFYVFNTAVNPNIMDGLCTHINVGFLGVNKSTYTLEVSDGQKQILTKVMLLKKKFKDLKVIISVGGAGEMGFNSMVSNHTTRKKFIKSCIEFTKKFHLDGVDLDWEWPVVNSGNAKEKVKFVQLLREIQQEFNRHKKKYILTLDVPSSQEIIELGYYVKYIAEFVDFVNVMCYDYHYFTKLFPFTGHNAPLYSSDNYFLSKSNINYSISLWISNGMPKEKIILGIPTYGHTFKLVFSGLHFLLAPAKDFGSLGANGFADYQEICQFLKNESTRVVFDTVSKTPYAYKLSEWVSFENEKSMAYKATFALEEKLGGVMIFSVNADDVNGSCKGDNIPLPLIRKVRNILFNEV